MTASGRGIAVSSVVQFGSDSPGGGIVNAGSIYGTYTAIHIGGGVGTFLGGITNSGTLTDSTHGFGDVIVSGVSSFVGDISNTGQIEAANGYGIYIHEVATFDGSIVNANAISAFAGGIIVGSSQVDAVSFFSGGITNSGAITAGALIATTSGSYYEYYNQSIRVENVGDFQGGIVNASNGSLSGGITGIAVLDSFGSGTFSGGISNSGTITAAAYGVKVEDSATFLGGIVNESGATISAGRDGIIAGEITSFDGGITNSGSIAASDAGIGLSDVATFTGNVSNSGTISVGPAPGSPPGSNGTGIAVGDVSDFAGDVANSGGITAGVGIAIGSNVNFSGNSPGGDIVNSSTGTITAKTAGIRVSADTTNAAFGTSTPGGMTIVNAGTISATGAVSSPTSGSGIAIGPGGPGGNITGRGIVISAGVAVSIRTSSGTYTRNAGISVFDGSISNSGTIKAAGTGVFVGNTGTTPGSVAISTFAGGITNSGTISGGKGILLNDIATFSGDIVNGANGQIVASSGDGIEIGQQAVRTNYTYTPPTGTSTRSTVSTSQVAYSKRVGTFDGSIVNNGTISAPHGVGINLSSVAQFSGADPRGDIVNTGMISGSIGIELVNTPDVSVFDSGVITGTGGTAIEFDGGATSDNTLTLAAGYAITGDVVGGGTDTLALGGSGSADFDFDNIGAGQQYSGFTTFEVTGGTWDTTGSGSDWNVDGGILEVNGSAADTTVYAGGREVVENGGTADGTTITGGTMEVVSGGSVGSSITFASNSGTLQIDGPNTADSNLLPGTTISGFVSGDTIDLASIPNQTGSLAVMNYLTDVLTLTEGTETYTLDFSGNFVGDYFQTASDNGGAGPGTVITESTTAPCYCPGTLIRTPCGNKRVEKLQIGDELMTASGVARPIKWIGRRSYLGRFVMGRKDILPVCIKAGALDDNVPRRDLWISPNHAMYFEDNLDGVLIEAKDLINGVSIAQAERVEQVEYFHIELESHDVIIAEGALSESFIDDDSRGMFLNAHEYRALYPAAATAVAQYCATRLDEGYEVEAIRQRLAARVGLESRAYAVSGALRGYVDRITPHVIEGWAQNADHPEAPVCLDICAGGRLLGRVLANHYREDLKNAGMGSGCHAFAFTPPPGVALLPEAIDVCRSLDGAPLPLSAKAKPIRTSVAA
jgi:Hint domain